MKHVPEKCCAKCRYLLKYEKGNAYGDVEYLCVKIGRYINGIYKDLSKVRFFRIGMDTPALKDTAKCIFERKETPDEI